MSSKIARGEVANSPSLGRRLSAWLAIQGLLAMAVICSAVYLDASASLSSRQTEVIANKRAQIQHLIAEANENAEGNGLRHTLNDILAGHDEMGLRVYDQTGRSVYARPAPVTSGMVVRTDSFVIPRNGSLTAYSAILEFDTSDDEMLLRRLGLTLVLAAVVGSALAAAAANILVRIGLRPVRALAEQARGLAASNLDHRLGADDQPQELRPLVDQINELLARLESSYEHLEGFNADVAHELCTPLTTLLSSSELALRRGRSEAELVEIIGSNLEELRRLAGIVNDMLFLSRADRGAKARREHVPSLADVIRTVTDYHDADIESAGLRVHIMGDASGDFDTPLVRRAISNLLLNAARYGRRSTVISIRIETDKPDESVRVAIDNVGPTIPASDLRRIFDRFYRADTARPGASRHHGLGLSIVSAIARMHGGGVFAESREQHTTVGFWLMTSASLRPHNSWPPESVGKV
jgi:two-component system heavy metal sensor histidine kinase CusS